VQFGVPKLPAPATTASGWTHRLRRTLGAREPWLMALSFAMYSGQWLAVVGFLPTLYQQAGMASATVGVLTALAAAVNALGNLAGGALLQRGVTARRLMTTGFLTMAGAALLAYAFPALPAALRFAAVLAFSMVGGMIPATLFSLAVHAAPDEDTIATTVGWMQQWSAFGQFIGPPLVAWVASRVGGWQWTWAVTGACSAAGLLLARTLATQVEKKRYAAIRR
jgi:predicted MFS family arabinose efflux permease